MNEPLPAGIIRILDKALADRIAAGEVIERPASAVKELIENAIDAQATLIAVEIREGGLALIRVSDNGQGMSRADAPLALERFATSKIAREQDLLRVRTLGFRGEALPSIAAVSQMELVTRTRDEIEGTRTGIANGRIEREPSGAPIGTQVIVRHLFYNTPARRKFLKSPFRESELIQKTIAQYALAYPHIAFRLVGDGREIMSVGAHRDVPLQRIGAIWGREVADEMIPIDYVSVDVSVRGFVSRPTLARGSREWQMFYANGRPIRAGLLAVMLERPYAGRLPPNRRPLAVIQIEVNPQFVDVNVHPRKAEVRFYQERAIYNAVTHAVGRALSDYPLLPQTDTTDWSFANAPIDGTPLIALKEPTASYMSGEWRALGQIHNTYLLAQTDEGLVIVDQHAAQEQVFFEQLTNETGQVTDQRVSASAPVVVPVLPKEAQILNDALEIYQSLGIDIEPFGANAFRVNALPGFVTAPLPDFLTALLAEHETHRALDPQALRGRLASKIACVSAYKAGDALTMAQQQKLLDDLTRSYSPATCPHGRPAFVAITLGELERRFGRR